MKILVTGGFGFLGSHYVNFAHHAGHDLFIVDALTYAGRSRNVQPSHATFSITDIRDALSIERVFEAFKPDVVVHFAAETHVTRSIACADTFLTTNVRGTHVLLEAALTHGVKRFVHVSTDEVYGSLSDDAEKWTEASPYRPRNPYSASKAAADHLVSSYHETFDLPTVIVHASNCFGGRQHPEKLIPTLIRQAIYRRPFTLHGDGLHTRDWLAAEDFVRGVHLAVMLGGAGETYNFPGSGELRNRDVAALIAQNVPWAVPTTEYVPDRPGNDRRYGMSGDKVKAAFGFENEYTLAREIPRVMRWYEQHPGYASDYGR